MSTAIEKAPDRKGFLVKEESVRKQLGILQNKYFEITTIKDALRVQSAAEALAIVARELEVHERYQADAEVMVRRCEVRMGELSLALPRSSGGGSTAGRTVTVAQCKALQRAGKDALEIAGELKISVPTVHMRLRGIEPRRVVTIQMLHELHAAGLAAREIAKQFGMRPSVVRKKLMRKVSPPTRVGKEEVGKTAVLARAGISVSRARTAEHVAKLPDDQKERVIREAGSVTGMGRLAGIARRETTVPLVLAQALMAELENRRIRPRDPILDALVQEWNKRVKRQVESRAYKQRGSR